MNLKKILLTSAAPIVALGLGAALLTPGTTEGYSLIGGSLSQAQRDVRIYNNFTKPAANNNTTPHASFPGYTGAVMAIWKATVEWGSELHGDGSGDPHQNGDLGSGGANYDPSFQGEATKVGGTNSNIHSQISGSSGGVLAYAETPISDGWRIRYYEGWNWADGPGASVSGEDLQGVATHEFGHAIGLGHSGVNGATMFASISGTGVGQRSITTDDMNGVQAVYGAKSATKPLVTGYLVNGNSIKVLGSGFDPSGNQVWFTQKGKGGNGVPIKVTNKSSGSGGTTITVNLPATAGPGDILVRRNSTAHSGLSNAWPFDPGVSGQICGIKQYGLGLGGANIGILASISTPTLGTTISLVASSFAGSSSGLAIFSLVETSTPLLGGTLLMDYLNPVAQLSFTTGLGFGVIPVPLPATPSLAYLPVYAQVAVLDGAQPFGWALSNGLEITLCP